MATAEVSPRLEEIKDAADELGYQGAADKLGVTKETIRRRVREWHKIHGTQEENPIGINLMKELAKRYSRQELARLAKGNLISPNHDTVQHTFDGDELTIGVISDTHLGSIYTDPNMLFMAFDEFAKQGVDFITHSGDVFEGMSNRAGHIYECSHLGFTAQLEHGIDVFGRWTDTPIYMIDGNHDRWYIKSNGAIIVKELAEALPNVRFIGHDEGDIEIGNVVIKLWHGEDGSSYAYSYRIQKLVEAFTGGQKPNVLICGHTHKALGHMFDRNIHCTSAGAIQQQSKWMRSKRHANHTGFFIIRMVLTENEVVSYRPEFFPFYK